MSSFWVRLWRKMNESTQVLQKYFGYSSFRSGQQEIIQSIIGGSDTLALLPTGGGKSICFQVPGLILGRTTIVISPLISLMKDQVDALHRKGISAAYINSSLSTTEQIKRLHEFSRAKFDFLYVSPERLLTSSFLKIARQTPISLLVIDEAHCISEWGHDFRPEYRKIVVFIHNLRQKPIIAAFTATATPEVQADICQVLRLKKPQVFSQSFLRENLNFSVLACQSRAIQDLQLLRILKQRLHQSGIIYCLTRSGCMRIKSLITTFLDLQQIAVYHGGLPHEVRNEIQEKFLSNQLKLIVATNAFGMGVDKPNVRFVIHTQIPASLENYYQEAGRAGRDRQSAECFLLFNPFDLEISATLINESGTIETQKHALKKLVQISQFAATQKCRNQTILHYFGEESSSTCGHCDVCLKKYISRSEQECTYLEKLETWVHDKGIEHRCQPQQILHAQSLEWLSLLQPKSPTDYLKIPGIGQGWLTSWYHQLPQDLRVEIDTAHHH